MTSKTERKARRETAAGDRLPWSHQIDERTVATRDGMLMQVIQIDGLPFETVDTDDLNYRHAIRETMLRAIADPHFAIYHHIIRHPVSAVLDGCAPDPFCREVDAAWAARLASRRMFVNSLFLTVMRRPLAGRNGALDRAAALFRPRNGPAGDHAGVRDLDTGVDAILRSLAPYGARRLTDYPTRHGTCSEPLEFLSFLFNGQLQPDAAAAGQTLASTCRRTRVSFGGDTIDQKGATETHRRFAAMVSIKDYPATTSPGMLDNILRLPHELVITQSFGFVDRTAALERMNLSLRRLRATDDDALSLRGDLTVAKDNVAAGRSSFGEHHFSVQVRVSDLGALDLAVADVVSGFTDLGLVAVREDVAMEPVYWSQFPGNFKDIARKALISTGNFAALASLHNFPVGQAHGNHWGDAITILETTSGTPYHFNFHRGDLGNFTIIGPSRQRQDRRPDLPACPGGQIGAANRLFRQGSRCRDIRPRHRWALQRAAPGAAVRLQSAGASRTRRATASFLTEWVERLLAPVGGRARCRRSRSRRAALSMPISTRTRCSGGCGFSANFSAAVDRPRAGDLAHRLRRLGRRTASAPGCSTMKPTDQPSISAPSALVST